MDTFVTGKKGSGKTYYAVNYINDLPPEKQSKILSNIKGLKLGLNIADLCKKWQIKPIDLFRDSLHDEESPLHDQRFLELRGYTFFVDECQKLFPKSFKDNDVMQFFQMSRHYDIECFLLTQDEKLVCPQIAIHPEFSLRAVSDTANPIPGYFLYRKMISWEQVGLPIKVKKKKEVFELYESTDTGEPPSKKPKPMMLLAGICIVAIILVFVLLRFFAASKKIEPDSPHIENSKNYRERVIESQMRKRPSYSESTTTQDQYPPSMIEKIGGIMMPVSHIEDRRGKYIMILGVLYKDSRCPYPVIETPLGYHAIVPQDVFDYQQKINEKAKNFSRSGYNPNQAYVYNDKSENKKPSKE